MAFNEAMMGLKNAGPEMGSEEPPDPASLIQQAIELLSSGPESQEQVMTLLQEALMALSGGGEVAGMM